VFSAACAGGGDPNNRQQNTGQRGDEKSESDNMGQSSEFNGKAHKSQGTMKN